MGLVFLETQPSYPNEDLSDTNAAMLELLLLNHEAFEKSHETAESQSFLYWLSHRALIAKIHPSLPDKEAHVALDHGIAAFEVISALVSGTADRPGHSKTDALKFYNREEENTGSVHLLADSTELFDATMQNTRHVVTKSAERSCPSSRIHYAIAGAALAFYNELDMLQHPDIHPDNQ
jgi:hypothetical protein